MNNLALNTTEYFTTHNDVVKTTSLKVAEVFGKQHKDVLKAVRNLEINDNFKQRNFAPSSYINNQGKEQPMIEMTKNGFSLIVMGFTGKDALNYKIKYIEAFDKMAMMIKTGGYGLQVPANFRDALLLAANQQDKIEAQKIQIASDAPKVIAYDLLEGSKDWYCITTAGKMLKMRRIDLTDWLNENKWIYKRVGSKNWQAYSSKTQPKYLSMKPFSFTGSDGYPRTIEQVMITAKGLAKLAELMGIELEGAA